MSETATSIHGHDLLDMIRQSPDGVSVEQLATAVRERFGVRPRFHTCSFDGMKLGQLLEFLFSRGKLSVTNGRLRVVEENVCQH